jgi:hypothetical protein
MKLPDINTSQQQMPPMDPARRFPHDAPPVKNADHPSTPGNVNDESIDLHSQTARFSLQKLEVIKSAMDEAANSIRTADHAMHRIGTKIVNMKSTLTEILKQYPPFPPGSEERVAILKRFSALRRQIDALSFPPDDTGAQRILSIAGKDEKGSPSAGPVFSQLGINVRRLPVDTGPEGLDIPDLPNDAEDEQISRTLDVLSNAQNILDSKQDLLTKDAERITRMQ